MGEWIQRPWGSALVGADGRWEAIRLGTHHEAMPELLVLPTARSCVRCHQPTIFARPPITGERVARPLHPACTGWLDSVEQHVLAEILRHVVHELHVTDIQELEQ